MRNVWPEAACQRFPWPASFKMAQMTFSSKQDAAGSVDEVLLKLPLLQSEQARDGRNDSVDMRP